MAKNKKNKKKTTLRLYTLMLFLVFGVTVFIFIFFLNQIRTSKIVQKIEKFTRVVQIPEGEVEVEKKVKLDFYVMSQCPYGTQVEDTIAPVMQKMSDVVDLNIDFITSPKTYYQGKEETYCIDNLCSMHGIPEVQGDIVQLCVNKIDSKKSLDFIVCQNKNAPQIPNNWQACADSLELDKDAIQACYEGEEGKNLLAESSAKADEKNATASPTIYLNDEKYGGGRSEFDFQKAICEVIENEHQECKNLPVCMTDINCTEQPDKIAECVNAGSPDAKCEYKEAQPFDVTILYDTRCQNQECSNEAIDQIIAQMKGSFKGIKEIKKIEYSSEEGSALYTKNSLKTLPAFLFPTDVETAYFFNDLQGYLTKRGDYYELAVGASFDPTLEICDNGIDDTGNGLADCADTTCQEQTICREESKGKLDLFVMSQCPYGTMALNAMPTILDAFGDEINFDIYYIANEMGEGEFQSLHGQPEVDENIRELCVIQNYAENNQYMDYIVCRNKNIQSTEWEECAQNANMDVEKIKNCSEGDEGKKLLSENIKLAEALQIGASPTWMTNNKYQFNGIDAATVQTEICKYNPDFKGCSVDLSGKTVSAPAGSCN